MSKPSARNRKAASLSPTAVFLIAGGAFAAGVGMTWLSMREQGASSSTQLPTFVVQGPGTAGGSSTAVPPDVSQLPPVQSAVMMGNWNYDRKNWSKAIEDYQRALSLGMDNADVRTDLGNSFRFSGEPRKALEQYQIARRENPQHENSLFNTATLYSEVLNEPANAVNAWREYLRLFPDGKKAAVARQFLKETDSRAPDGVLENPAPNVSK